MYHWFLLIKKYSNAQIECSPKLIAGHEPERHTAISSKTYGTLFFLGFIECMPTALGGLATNYLDELLFPYDYILAGVLLSALLVQVLRKKAPQIPISIHY